MTYDPYTNQGGYDAYGQYQTFDDSPPPEPSKDWDDVPKINRSYVRKLQENVLQKDFTHLNTEKLYLIEAIVEYIKLNEKLMVKQESKENVNDEIVTTLKILNIPPSELSVARDERKLETKTATQSAISLVKKSDQLSKFFQRMSSYAAKLANQSENDIEDHEEEEKLVEYVGADEGYKHINTTMVEKEEEQITQETDERTTIKVMEGKSVIFLMSGVGMIQNLQTKGVKVTVNRINITKTEEGDTSETVLLGTATVRLPQTFHEAVLRQATTKGSFSKPLVEVVEDEVIEVGEVGLSVTLVSMGQGVEVAMSDGPRVYTNVKFIEAFPLEPVEHIMDPMVHPQLAVILMNMEPPVNLNRTSSEIIQNCLDAKLLTPEDNESESLKYKPNTCRWLEISKQLTENYSEFYLSSKDSTISSISCIGPFSPIRLLCQEQKIDSELNLLWRKHKLQCKGLWEDVEALEKRRKALHEELDELIRQDKGEGWGSEILSENSETPNTEEERLSKPSITSGRKSTLKSY